MARFTSVRIKWTPPLGTAPEPTGQRKEVYGGVGSPQGWLPNVSLFKNLRQEPHGSTVRAPSGNGRGLSGELISVGSAMVSSRAQIRLARTNVRLQWAVAIMTVCVTAATLTQVAATAIPLAGT